MSTDGLLGALQLADSSLPIGRFAHSYGLESMLAEWPELEEAELGELVETAIRESVGPLDGVAVAHAHRAVSAGELHELDAWLTARKLAPGARRASTSCGRRLAALTSRLTDREPVIAFAAAVDAGESDGNLAVVHGDAREGTRRLQRRTRFCSSCAASRPACCRPRSDSAV